jgi:hypothetical protein
MTKPKATRHEQQKPWPICITISLAAASICITIGMGCFDISTAIRDQHAIINVTPSPAIAPTEAPALQLTTTASLRVPKSVAKQRAAIKQEENNGSRNALPLVCKDWDTLPNDHQHCASWGRDLPKERP